MADPSVVPSGSSIKQNNLFDKKRTPFNDSLDDDFQENQPKNKIICNLTKIKKKHEDEAFSCAVCNKDLTSASIEERASHINQCIDNQNSVDNAFMDSSSQPSSVFILDCPLCFKSFPSPELRSTHIKKCGKSRGLSIQSVIQAVHLQEKHVLERRALGLPLHRTNQSRQPKSTQGPSKKNLSKRLPVAPKSSLQSDLQLAKALSLSLKEKESQSQQNYLQDVYPSLQPPSEIQNPGRVTAKRKQLNHLYPLLFRTEEERRKIIQDKINDLMITMIQPNQKAAESSKSTKENEKGPFLWNLCGKAEDKSSYYVEQLLDWILPSEVEIGSKLCSLSQVPGHRIFTQLPCDYTFSCDKTIIEEDKMPENSQLPSLINSLQTLIGNSWMSDIDIHTASGIVIPAHKLILALRCSSLKNAFNEPINIGKPVLNWQDTSFEAALHFLNFLYTGTTEWKDDIFDELLQLAKKYEVKDLLFILNNSCEASEFIMDEDSRININSMSCEDNLDGKDKRESTEQEYNSKENSMDCSDSCVENQDSKSSSLIKDAVVIKDQNNSFAHDKIINTANLSCAESDTSYSSKIDLHEQDVLEFKNDDPQSPLEVMHDDHIKAKHSFENNKSDLDDTIPLIIETESSNDSCKILYTESKSLLTPNKNIQDNIILSQPFAHDYDISTKSDTPTKTIHAARTKNLGKNSTPEKPSVQSKYNSIDLNDNDVVVMGGFRRSNEKISPYFQDKQSPNKSCKLDRISNGFLNSPFQMEDDFNSALCLSQNECLQFRNSENWEYRDNSLVHQSTDDFSSPNKFHTSQQCEGITESVGNSSKDSFQGFDKSVDSRTDVVYEKNSPSPDIFICDSEIEIDSDLSKDNLQRFGDSNNSRVSYSPCTFSDPSISSNPKIMIASPVKVGADLHKESEDKNEYSVPPEVICCDSSSSEESLSQRIFKKFCESPNNEVSDSCQALNEEYDNQKSMLSETLKSPDSPWVFQVYKPSRILKESSCTTSAAVPRKDKEIISQSKTKNSTLNEKKSNESKSTFPCTPSSAAFKFQISNSPITPLPDFKSMKTPEIKEALKKVGVKPLPRKKAVAVLSHIYDETHPFSGDASKGVLDKNGDPDIQTSPEKNKSGKVLNVPTKRKKPAEKNDKATKKKQKANILPYDKEIEEDFVKESKKAKHCSSQPTKSFKTHKENKVNYSQKSKQMTANLSTSPTESCNSREEYEGNFSFSSDVSDSDKTESKEDPELIKEYILSNDDLYTKVLNYMPLNLADLKQELKENGIKISIPNLMDFLDEQCITFTLPRKEEYRKKQQLRSQRFKKRMIAKFSQPGPSNSS